MKHLYTLLVLAITLLAGCASQSTRQAISQSGQDVPLMAWLDQQLIPHLRAQFAANPALNDQAFFIVSMKGDDTQPEIDGMRQHVRNLLKDALAGNPGVKLIWRPAVKPWHHPRTLDDLNCVASTTAAVQLSLDLQKEAVGEQWRLVVNSLDVEAGQWVPGVRMVWRGALTEEQIKALQLASEDEVLRGLRPLPFKGSQADLLASYMAQNLSCLLKEQQAKQLVLYSPPLAADVPSFFRSTMGQVDNYLSRFHEIKVTTDPSKANVSIDTEVHRIDGRLHQIWATVRFNEHLDGGVSADAQAYVVLSQSQMNEAAPIIGGAEAMEGSHQPAMTTPLTTQTQALIAEFNLVSPSSRNLCDANQPFMLGAQPVSAATHLPSGHCVGLNLTAGADMALFLFNQTQSGQIVRLLPNPCQALGAASHQLTQSQSLHVPQDPANGTGLALKLDDHPGIEYFYAVAVSQPDVQTWLQEKTAVIPDICNASAPPAHFKPEAFQRMLEDLKRLGKGHLQWQVRQFHHDA